MNYKGVIIEESLGDKTILDGVRLIETRVEQVSGQHKTPWLTQWTLDTVEIPEEGVDAFAERLSRSFDSEPPTWYADFKNDVYHFVVFAGKIFKVDMKNPTMYQNARAYGVSLGIPDYQVDFTPEDDAWNRD